MCNLLLVRQTQDMQIELTSDPYSERKKKTPPSQHPALLVDEDEDDDSCGKIIQKKID